MVQVHAWVLEYVALAALVLMVVVYPGEPAMLKGPEHGAVVANAT